MVLVKRVRENIVFNAYHVFKLHYNILNIV